MSSELEKREKREVKSATAEALDQSGRAYSPDVDIYLNDDEVAFLVDVPGVAKGDITIQVDETDTLVIRAGNSASEPEGAVLRQYAVGDYYRAFQISEDYDKDKIAARVENGLLTVTIPKREEAKPRRIEVTA